MSKGSERTSDFVDRKPVRRRVKLPGESRHAECVDSPAVIARKLIQAKREKKLRAMQRNG